MNRLLAFFLFLSITFFSHLNAAVYKGQMEFLAECIGCHHKPFLFLETKTKSWWKKEMSEKGKSVAYIHIKSLKAKDSWKYFRSKQYSKKARHLSDFLQEYAKDSGNIPIFD